MGKIEFHCPQCDRLIKAPEGSGGKKGVCPSCGRTVYIPTPSDELEPYDLAPVDEADQRHQAQLEAEALAQQQAILHERGDLDSAGDTPSARSQPADSKEDPRQMIISYLLAMSESRLDDAQRVVDQLRRRKKAARKALDELGMDSLPPEELAGIPEPVRRGFLKSLASQL